MSETSNGVKPLVGDPPPVNIAAGIVKPLPEHLQRTINLFQRFMRSPVGAIVFALIAFTIGSPPVIGVTPVLFLLQLLGVVPHWPIRRFFDQCTANWMSFMTMVYEKMYGIKIRTFGHSGKFKRRSLIIMNHVSHIDWMYLWSVIDRQGDLSFWKVVTKKFPVRSFPIIGQCMQLNCFIFIERNWEKDKEEFRDKLYYYNAINYPVQLLLFPEGGDFTPKMKKRSDQFAAENNLPVLDYCFHPRTTGFKYAVNALRDGVGGLDAIYDLTIAYPDVFPKTEIDVGQGILPREVHFHVKKHDDEDVPQGQEELEKWLRDRWLEKDERLKKFYRHKEFQEDTMTECVNGNGFGNHNGFRHTVVDNGHSKTNSYHSNGSSNGTSPSSFKSPEVIRPRNMLYFMYSIFIFIFTNLLMFVPMYYYPYFNLYMLLGILFLCFGHYWKGMGHLFMLFKRKEIQQEIKNSKFNN